MKKSPEINEFLLSYEQSLATFSPEKVAEFYMLPFILYTDKGPQVVEKKSEIVAFFSKGMSYYKDNNISKTSHEILSVEQLSENIVISKIIWTNFDAAGKESGKEANCYILSGNGKDFKIMGLIPINDLSTDISKKL